MYNLGVHFSHDQLGYQIAGRQNYRMDLFVHYSANLLDPFVPTLSSSALIFWDQRSFA